MSQLNKVLIENEGGHGAIPINRLHRFVHRKLRRKKISKLIGGLGFDWTLGFDIRSTVGAIAVKNQGSNDSCSGQAGGYFLEIQRRLQKIQEPDLSAKSIYSQIAYPVGGTTVTALMTHIGAHGANIENAVPSVDVNGNPLTEANMRDKSWMTPALTKDALSRAGYTPYDCSENIDDVATTIEQYGAVIFEITGQNNQTWTSAMPLPPSKSNPNELWHHFMCGIGAKMYNGKKCIVALQSEGYSWGELGVQYISEDYFKSGHVDDVFTFIYDTQLIPSSSNYSIWAEVARWFKIHWKMANGFS